MATAGDDSDSGASDTELETREDHIFYDELTDLFKQGMVDKGMFENSINEIDAMRKTNNQNANAVMVMVMQGLLMLPTIFWLQDYQQMSEEHRKNAAFTQQYFDQLHEVLRKFQGLVEHFVQSKYAKDNYKQGIEKAIEPLYRQLILRIRQDIVDLLRVIEDETGLTFAAIIADIHAGKYGETPDEALPFGMIPLYEELQSDIAGRTSQKLSPGTAIQMLK